jgi:predicted secreted protein
LNEKSLMIARELCGDEGDIYENSVVRLKEKENKLNRLRAERMLDEYNECTFHPKLRY